LTRVPVGGGFLDAGVSRRQAGARWSSRAPPMSRASRTSRASRASWASRTSRAATD